MDSKWFFFFIYDSWSCILKLDIVLTSDKKNNGYLVKWYWHDEKGVATIYIFGSQLTFHLCLRYFTELPLYKNFGSPSLIYLIRNLLYSKGYYFTLRKDALQVLSDCECNVRGLKPKAHFPYVDKTVLCSGPCYGLVSYTTVLPDCESS